MGSGNVVENSLKKAGLRFSQLITMLSDNCARVLSEARFFDTEVVERRYQKDKSTPRTQTSAYSTPTSSQQLAGDDV